MKDQTKFSKFIHVHTLQECRNHDELQAGPPLQTATMTQFECTVTEIAGARCLVTREPFSCFAPNGTPLLICAPVPPDSLPTKKRYIRETSEITLEVGPTISCWVRQSQGPERLAAAATASAAETKGLYDFSSNGVAVNSFDPTLGKPDNGDGGGAGESSYDSEDGASLPSASQIEAIVQQANRICEPLDADGAAAAATTAAAVVVAAATAAASVPNSVMADRDAVGGVGCGYDSDEDMLMLSASQIEALVAKYS
ncbi:hypothetical protein VOLCADRAFT_91500 [Volvox carteri f. nagariensis]|uniref:Uncharacterized protein n=1 Tax=Volvox carteri f. nagariensis TaxID=3068 RepID=D8TX85_VOLCA|nr:uncharacterized protein VOLCADRAFT_91500 [Volvox carteri f. nagariensis]EFJ47867.1 hypothetical protein VOLCADRAFT_91500 [Volvox carteri f. nagariensis]|eukprot:XP_002950973.1 hypothetical protein VOLCADRAFT_91500 [Volvox carteri f. nagariensis]